jgi:tetratricopeptide (TPR) repeat protein
MRIECEVCSATYTIDDAQLSDQPIGAQCPYCGHVRLVKKGDAAAPAFNAPQSISSDLALSAPPPPPPMKESPFLGNGPPSPFGGAGNGGSPFGGSPFGGSPFAASPFAAEPVPPPPSGSSPGMQIERTSQRAVSAAPVPDAGGATCQVCGTPLTDEFDKVIGLCDVHQRDRRGAEAARAPAQSSQWYVRSLDGRSEGPMDLEDLRQRIRSGEFSPDDDFSQDGHHYGSIASFKDIAYLASLKVGGQSGGASRSSFARPRPGVSVGRLITPLLVLGVLGGLGFLGFTQRDQLVKVYQDLTTETKVLGPAMPNPLKRYLAKWGLAHPDVAGTAHEHLVNALQRHREDTWRGYEQAEQGYQRALLLDPDDPTAIAGYAENLAIWRYQITPPDELAIVRSAVAYAKDLAPENPAVHRAHAALSLAAGDLNGCRAGADEAIKRDATDGQAKLLLAGCYMEGNVKLAVQEIEAARKLVPELRRADLVLAEAYTRMGRFASAFRVLDERLEVDPNNGNVHLAYGDIARDLALFDGAREAYQKAAASGGDVQAAHLALGDLALELGDAGSAINHYEEATESRPIYGVRAVRAYAGWAQGELLRGRGQRAAQLAEVALKSGRDDPSATLYLSQASIVRGEAGLMTGSATTATTFARRALDASGGEPSALVLLGRAAMAQGRVEQAIKHFEDAASSDSRDPRLKGILAATYLGRGGYTRAFSLMRRAADEDPLVANSRRRAGPLALTDLPVREAIEQFKRATSEDRNASVANAAIGMLYYHSRDRARAQAAVERALRADDSNVAALIYDAQLALDRGNAKAAESTAQKLLAVERGSALGYLLLGRSLKAQGKKEEALEKYEAALRSNPGLLVARVEIAELMFDTGDRQALLGQVEEAFRVNPHALETRLVLYRSGI